MVVRVVEQRGQLLLLTCHSCDEGTSLTGTGLALRYAVVEWQRRYLDIGLISEPDSQMRLRCMDPCRFGELVGV